MRLLIRLFAFCCAVFSMRTACAHDFWIEPSTFRPVVGQNMTAALRVGQDFVGDAVPRSSQLMDSFIVRDGAGERAVNGFENQDPAGYLRVEKPGLAMIGYRSKPYRLELAADRFETFLRTEGLESIRALRAQRGESQKPDREQFYRYAKAVVAAGSVAGRFDQPFGYRYEIVPETNPLSTSPLRLRLLFESKPLAGVMVTAIHRDDPAARLSTRSDSRGRVAFSLPKSGVWLVKSVYIVPAPAGSNVDWESLWASLTFER